MGDSRRRANGRSNPLGRLASLVVRRPRLVVSVWLLLLLLLGVQSIGLDKKLTSRPSFVDGSAAKRENEVVLREFGSEDAMVVMLQGPAQAIERQGPKLERRLEAIPGMLVSSPWDSVGTLDQLRPSPDTAALLVNVGRKPGEEETEILPLVRRQVSDVVVRPVHASLAGQAPIVESYREAVAESSTFGERIAVPVLLIVLLLVFRSVLAAAIPVVIGGAVVVGTRGVLHLLLPFTNIDAFALGAAGMMGLALGVDYSLLIVSRFREELSNGRTARQAAEVTVTTTGRSVIPAGCGLVMAMVVASQLVSGALIASVALAVIVAALLSVLSALTVVPAVLLLLGSRLDRWSLPRRVGAGGAMARLSRRVSRRPRLALLAVLFLALAAAWSFTLNTDTGAIELLPPGDPGRQQEELVRETLGPGWLAPFEVVMDGGNAPVTTPERIRALSAFQRRVERDPGVEAMTGFARLGGSDGLGDIDRELAGQERGLSRLGDGIDRVNDGASLSSDGIHRAANGARKLGSAVGAAHSGADALAGGLDAAGTGTERLAGGLDRSSEGSGRLARGTEKASGGAGRLAAELDKAGERIDESVGNMRLLRNALRTGDAQLEGLHDPVQATADGLASAEAALQQMTVGQTDPQYAAALEAVRKARGELTGTDPVSGDRPDPDYEGVGAEIEAARGQFSLGLYLADRMDESNRDAGKGIDKLAEASAKLDQALDTLARGSDRMAAGLARLSRGGQKLSPGLRLLGGGAERLTAGLSAIDVGAAGLADGLSGGAQKSELLAGALGRIQSGLERQSGDSPLDRLRQQSPGLFDSGYFYLASLDGSRPEQRKQAGFVVNVDSGGRAARMLVVQRADPFSDAAAQTWDRLNVAASDLARDTGTEVFVGGVTPTLLTSDTAFRDEAPITRLALALITLIVLIPVVRSLTIPLLAALLNVLTVAATFGLLALLFDGSLLGGPGYVETMIIPTTIMVIFGLAIDYEVFLFARMREEYVRTGSPSQAIEGGIGRTAHIITGAATIMIAVFVVFSLSSFPTLRAFGTAQAIGVAIDAFLIRLLIVPSLLRAMGSWAWWMPAWLDRLLPGGTPAPSAAPASATESTPA